MKRPIVFAVIIVVVALAGVRAAQQAGFARTQLQDQELSVAGRHVVQARADFEPGAATGKHTHPGEEIGYVLEGKVQITIAGHPPAVFKQGDAIFVPAGAVHEGKNVGTTAARILSTYVLEKGKPLSTPVK